MNKAGIYIHIPFCKSKCFYCDFNSFANKEEYIVPYFSALNNEISVWSEKLNDRTFDTIYFGGGTPSFVETGLLCDVIERLKNDFNIANDCEITVECNPGTIGFESFLKLKSAGVNRLSIGLQSTDNYQLKALGRIHTVEDFATCFADARRAGFDNISLDLMYGLSDMNMAEWEQTLDKAIDFGAEHISVYALKIEEGTPFSKRKLALPNDDLCADMYEKAVDTLRKAGYDRYEISNFARARMESRHNQKYWELDDFLGLGAGAYSCVEGVRFCNESDIVKYIERVSEKGLAVIDEEYISKDEQMSEFVFLGLRCEKGISITEFEERFGQELLDKFAEPIKKYINLGFLTLEGDRLHFLDKGFFVSNVILADFV